MLTAELESRAMRTGAALVAGLVTAAGLAADAAAALGVAAGGAVALLNFRWLCRDATRLGLALAGGAVARWRLLPALLRQGATLGALGALLASGAVHPAGVAVGLATLPPTLLIHGLRGAGRDASES